MQSNFKIVTISSGAPIQDYYCYQEFFASIRRNGHEPLVLGQDPGEYSGLSSKPKLLRKAILNNQVETKYIIFADSWDLVFANKPEEIMELFKTYNSPFVCNAERNCFPLDLKDQFPECNTSFRYLNSGFIVAETAAILTILESMELDNILDDYMREDGSWHQVNDQLLFHEQFIKQPVKMVLDYQQALCQTMHDVQLDELDLLDENGIRNKETGMYPMAFHLNGGGKTSGVRVPILKRLGL